jgi:membrane-bound serine protease (ClpP class)
MGLDMRTVLQRLRHVLPLLVVLTLASAEAQPSAPVLVADVKGAIGVASTGFIQRAIDRARAQNATLLVLQLDTPGGLVSSTRDIISAMLASPVPIAVYVSPSGARAASAGTYIAYASHVSAMAPGTHLGAATPVSMGGMPGLPGDRDQDKKREDDKKKPASDEGSAMERKVLNDAVAYIRSLAQLRGRNADWAERAVRAGETLTADEALREKVIDVVARDLPDLLRQLDGRRVTAAETERVIATKGATLVTLSPDWRDRILAVITDPSIAYLLLIIGVYGIIFEFWSPGFVAPGVIGAISLLLGLAALSVLPVNYAGLALIFLGIALMTAEHFTPGIGVLGIGGLVSFVAGSVFLFEPTEGGNEFQIPWPVIAATSLAAAGLFLFVLGTALRGRKAAIVSGVEDMIGAHARVIDWTAQGGRVRMRGELWNARSTAALSPEDNVRIVAVDGLTLVVEPELQRR